MSGVTAIGCRAAAAEPTPDAAGTAAPAPANGTAAGGDLGRGDRASAAIDRRDRAARPLPYSRVVELRRYRARCP